METTRNMSNWEATGREDLILIPAMIAKGFTPTFNPKDVLNGRTSPEFMPIHAIKFVKEDLHVWQIMKDETLCWQSAKLIDGYYCHHTPVKNIEDLFADMK